ncbi:MAG: ribokinase [Proteobacteria bacterium]|nr:ribokinase [Pseudomonadota bacterium]
MPKLVNLGSLSMDHVYAVPALVGPGETISSLSHTFSPGGKGLNQSLAAALNGVEVCHVGCVGDDGQVLLDVLSKASVDVTKVRTVSGSSGHAVIQVDRSGVNAIVIDGGANRCLTEADVDEAFKLLERGDWLLLQNEINDVPRVLARAKESKAKIAFNVAPVDERIGEYDFTSVDWLIVNAIEACAIAGEEDEKKAFDRLMESLPKTQILQTLGHAGLRYGYRSPRIRLPAFQVKPVDETAAGDAFTGVLLAALIGGLDVPESLTRASAAGALTVTRPGAASSIPDQSEINKFLSRRKPLKPY